MARCSHDWPATEVGSAPALVGPPSLPATWTCPALPCPSHLPNNTALVTTLHRPACPTLPAPRWHMWPALPCLASNVRAGQGRGHNLAHRSQPCPSATHGVREAAALHSSSGRGTDRPHNTCDTRQTGAIQPSHYRVDWPICWTFAGGDNTVPRPSLTRAGEPPGQPEAGRSAGGRDVVLGVLYYWLDVL